MAKADKRKSRRRSADNAEMKAFLASTVIDHIAAYCQRGRQLQGLSDDALTEQWKTVWNELTLDPISEKKRDVQADISAEFSLRDKETPWNLVVDQVELYLDASERAWNNLRKQNPGANDRINEGLESDLRKFRNRRGRSN